MIEGQESVTWADWVALARACEESGFEGLFRSDHYLSVLGRAERSSLDAWTILGGLAAVTERIKLGTAVSPATFRHPSVLAKSVVTVDQISEGRVELGMGAGWLEAEHRAYGFPFAARSTRIEVLEEQVEIVARSWNEGSFDFDGKHYRIEDLDALPKPLQRPRPNLIIGGDARARSAALAGRWADEYNTTSPTVSQCEERRGAVERAFGEAGRDAAELTFSVMTGCVVGRDNRELSDRAQRAVERFGYAGGADDWIAQRRDRSFVGTAEDVIEQLKRRESAGVDRVMLQHIDHTDIDMVRLIGDEVIPAVA
jgi:F420-dependent oxidoreductase-like protein